MTDEQARIVLMTVLRVAAIFEEDISSADEVGLDQSEQELEKKTEREFDHDCRTDGER